MKKELTIGILGPGNISRRFMKGAAFLTDAKVIACASRDIKKAQAYQAQYYLSYAYGSYIEMLKNPEIDIVYIATPPMMHAEQIMLCLSHNKHVLCEKPMLADEAELHDAFAYAKKHQLLLMEMQKAPLTFLNQHVKRLLAQKVIGDLRYIEASYCYNNFSGNYDHWVYRQEDGGGMADVGVYAISYANYMADAHLCNIQTMAIHAPTGCDNFASAMLEYENGVKAYVKGALELTCENKAMLYGTKGYIETVNFWKTTTAILHTKEQEETITIDMPTDFYPEIAHAIECIQKGLVESPINSEQASMEVLKVVQAVRNNQR